MKVLVTGGLGFVGSVVSRHLLALGHEVVIVDDESHSVAKVPDGVELCRKSIGSFQFAELSKPFIPDVVMHFAASSMVGEGDLMPFEYLNNNVGEWSKFLRECMRVGVTKFVHSGTCAAYGNPVYVPIDEIHPLGPLNWYGWTKLMAERLLAQLGALGKVDYVGFRFFNIAGTGYGVVEQHKVEEHLIPIALNAAMKDVPLAVNGRDYPTYDGTCIRDYVHVIDLANAHVRAAQMLVDGMIKNEIINLGTGTGSSVLDVIGMTEKVTGKKIATVEARRRPGDSPKLMASNGKAKKLLGWEPTKKLEDSIRDAYEARKAAGL